MLNYLAILTRVLILLLIPAAAVGVESDSLTVEDKEQSQQCPVGEPIRSQNKWKKVNRSAAVLIGADVLGRIAIAADYDRDGFVDEVMQYTATTRLSEPRPVLLERAKITQTTFALMVEAADRSLAVALVVDNGANEEARPIPRSWRRYSEVIVEKDGVALYRTELPPVIQQQFAAYDHNSIFTWPENFQKDLLYVGTGVPTNKCAGKGCMGCECNDALDPACSTGGCGSETCPCASPCSGGPQACQPGWFACCVCTVIPDTTQYACTGDCVPCGPAEQH